MSHLNLIKSSSILVVFLAFMFSSSCAVNPVTGKKELSFMSEEQEIALGKQSDPSIVAMYGLFQNEKLQAFINEKGNEMARISHRPNLPFEFKVLDSPVVNAFAVPGGYVYFTRGILAHFNNEAEFAGVLGHEIGHVTARHSVKQQTQSTIAQILLIGGLVISPTLRTFANEAQQGMQLLFLKYSRDHESQSDELGVEYSTKVGYDAHHMANFFNTLSQMRVGTESESLPEFLSTHPDPANRYQRVNQLADKEQKNLDVSQLKENRNSYLQMIDGIIYGEDPQQGYVENDVFYHPELRFQFPIPAGWQTVNTPSQVQMAQSDGSAMMLLTLSAAKTLDEASAAVLEQYKLTKVEEKKLTLNGMPVLALVADQINEEAGTTARILTYFISYKEMIFTFHGIAELANFDAKISFFNNTMRNFTILKDLSKINRKPNRITIQKASTTASLESLLEQNKIPSDQYKEHALINGIALDQSITKGDLFKIIKK